MKNVCFDLIRKKQGFASRITPTIAFSIVALALVCMIGIFAPWVAPHSESAIITNDSFAPPSSSLWLGGDYLGRDVFSRLVYGTRVTLFLALLITFLSFLSGVTLGFVAAAVGGKVDMVISRINDAMLSFPSLMFALVVINSLGSSFPVLIITIALIEMTRVYRVSRALAADIMLLDFVEAAIVRGESKTWIILHEVLPNTLIPIAAEFGIRFTYAILFISALSFLGLGVQPPEADLGVMVKENLQSLLYGAYTALYPALAIAVIAVSMNVFVAWLLEGSGANISTEL